MKGDFGMADAENHVKIQHNKQHKGIFITGTGTDIGKTYVTALLAKALVSLGINAGYYKAAISGAESIEESDAGFVKSFSKINQDTSSLLSYLYKNPLSPHLAARIEGNPPELDVIKSAYEQTALTHDLVLVEGSGGIVCPIRCDEKAFIMLEDIIKELKLETLIVADAGLGTINAAVLTISYLREKNIGIRGVILNRFDGENIMHKDNLIMIEKLTGVPVVATVNDGSKTPNFLTDIKNIFMLGDETR